MPAHGGHGGPGPFMGSTAGLGAPPPIRQPRRQARQDVTIKDAQQVVYPRGLLSQAMAGGPAKLPALVTFRSKLEAHWANTLDQLGIRWAYEPQMFTLPNGQRYLPDFHLEELSTWLEVKGAGIPRIEKAISFARWRTDSLVVAGFSPALTRGRGFRMRFCGIVNRCGFALCPDCHRYQWAAETLECRACGAHIPEANFYQQSTAPFHPAPWAGD